MCWFYVLLLFSKWISWIMLHASELPESGGNFWSLKNCWSFQVLFQNFDSKVSEVFLQLPHLPSLLNTLFIETKFRNSFEQTGLFIDTKQGKSIKVDHLGLVWSEQQATILSQILKSKTFDSQNISTWGSKTGEGVTESRFLNKKRKYFLKFS